MKGIKKIVLTVIVAILILFFFSLIMYFAFGVHRSKPAVNEYNDAIESYEDEFIESQNTVL